VLHLINDSLIDCSGTNSRYFTMILSFIGQNRIHFKTRKKTGVPGFLFSATRNPGFKILPRIGNTNLLSFWLALSLLCDVMLSNNQREILMITSPLLRNVRHKTMIAPVRPPLTRLIHISPSCGTIYRLFKIIIKVGTLH